jgi:hypothetical protein
MTCPRLLHCTFCFVRQRYQSSGEREIFAVNVSARERGSSPRPGARANI